MLSVGVHVPLLIVHLNTYTPGTTLVTVVLYKVGAVINGLFGPLTNVQMPVPDAGLFPAKVTLVTLHKFCEGPAFDTDGVS